MASVNAAKGGEGDALKGHRGPCLLVEIRHCLQRQVEAGIAGRVQVGGAKQGIGCARVTTT